MIENKQKMAFITPENKFSLLLVKRTKTEDEAFSEYPHYFILKQEADSKVILHAKRESQNGDFIISTKENDFFVNGENFVAVIKPNFWGTRFEVFDFGLEEKLAKAYPFAKKQEKSAYIGYDTNIMAECPRSFEIDMFDSKTNKKIHLNNVTPKFNSQRQCFTLNFYGRATKASARNFQLVEKTNPDEILLMHGKITADEFNLDYRTPLNMVQAFSVSLCSIGKKRVVS